MQILLKNEKLLIFVYHIIELKGCSLLAQIVKNLSAVQETQVLSLGWEYPLEKGMASHSSILTQKIPEEIWL